MSNNMEINEWEREPNHVKWRDNETGFVCEIKRHMLSGSLLGYVGIPAEHSLYGIPLDAAESILEVSFSDFKEGSNLFWLGFDCANLGEIQPFWAETERCDGIVYVYRNIDYVRSECTRLAYQLRRVDETGIYWNRDSRGGTIYNRLLKLGASLLSPKRLFTV